MKWRWSTVEEDTAQGLDQSEMEKGCRDICHICDLSGLLNKKLWQIVKMNNFNKSVEFL